MKMGTMDKTLLREQGVGTERRVRSIDGFCRIMT